MNQDLLERAFQMLSGVFESCWSGLGEVHNEISSRELSRAATAKGPDTDWWLMPRRAKGYPRAHVSAPRGTLVQRGLQRGECNASHTAGQMLTNVKIEKGAAGLLGHFLICWLSLSPQGRQETSPVKSSLANLSLVETSK